MEAAHRLLMSSPWVAFFLLGMVGAPSFLSGMWVSAAPAAARSCRVCGYRPRRPPPADAVYVCIRAPRVVPHAAAGMWGITYHFRHRPQHAIDHTTAALTMRSAEQLSPPPKQRPPPLPAAGERPTHEQRNRPGYTALTFWRLFSTTVGPAPWGGM